MRLSNTLILQMQSKLLVPEILKNRIQSLSTTYGLSQENDRLLCENSKLENDNQFRVIELTRKKFVRRPRKSHNEMYFKQPREKVQPVTQDWGSVWPGIRSFHPATVPLPVRMGWPKRDNPCPAKWGNAELMKIPNFLHLTPPVVERQCAAIKKFCTPWPKGLESEEKQDLYFPVTSMTSSFLHSSTSVRDPRSRVVTIQINVEGLDLDMHSWDKLLRLVGGRFDSKTKILTLVANRCPLSSQNLDYCMYLLTVLYNEAKKTEPWEHEREELDFESFNFERSQSKQVVKGIEEKLGATLPEAIVNEYNEAITRIHNEGEDTRNVADYKNAVLKILNLA